MSTRDPHIPRSPSNAAGLSAVPAAAADPTVQLLQRWHAGDREALAELMQETQTWLRAAIGSSLDKRIRRVEDSADFAQSAILRFLTTGPRFLPANQGQFRALMKRIALNEIIDKQRRLRSAGQGSQSADRSHYGDTVLRLAGPDKSAAQPARIVAQDEERAWVRLATELLDEPERQLLYAREVDCRDWADIARELGYDSGDAARMACNRMLPKVASLVRKLQHGRLPEILAAADGT